MKKLNVLLAVSIGLVGLSSYILWGSFQSQDASQARDSSDHQHAGKDQVQPQSVIRAQTEPSRATSGGHDINPWQASPFETGASQPQALSRTLAQNSSATSEPEKEVVSAEELARRKKMAALGYMVPTDYYTKDVKTLRQLAKSGDAYAMVHLGEKYAFELNGQTTHPEFEQGIDYAKAAKQSFRDALVAGNIRSAGIIAELYFQEKNATEAYAWHLVSDQLGDDISADWFRRTEMAQQATPAVKQAAQTRALQIMAELKLTKKST